MSSPFLPGTSFDRPFADFDTKNCAPGRELAPSFQTKRKSAQPETKQWNLCSSKRKGPLRACTPGLNPIKDFRTAPRHGRSVHRCLSISPWIRERVPCVKTDLLFKQPPCSPFLGGQGQLCRRQFTGSFLPLAFATFCNQMSVQHVHFFLGEA